MKYQQSLEQLVVTQVSKRILWIEVLAITLLVPFIGYLIDEKDIFFIGLQFPLLWFAPLLVSLKYGIVPGLSSASFLISAIFMNSYFINALEPVGNPVMYSLGLSFVALLSGEFSDIWRRRLLRLSAASTYLSLRVKEVERAYLLMKISHDHLQKDRIKQPLSLHAHSLHLRNQVCQMKNNNSDVSVLAALADQLINIFVTFGRLNVASLHQVKGDQWLEETPLSFFGSVMDIKADDPLLREAILTQKVVSVQTMKGVSDKDTGQLLLAVPIVDLDGTVWAVIAVQHMSFEAFHLNNFQTLAVIGNHVGDLLLNQVRAGRDVQNDRVFIAELERCLSDRKNYGLDAVLLGFRFKEDGKSKALKKLVLKHRPGLNSILEPVREGAMNGVLMLLPMISEHECSQYLHDLSRDVEENFGFRTLRLAGIEVVSHFITDSDRSGLLLREFSLSGRLNYVPDDSLENITVRLNNKISA